MRHVKDPREVALRARRDAYAAVHTEHAERKRAENRRWVAAVDAVTETYRPLLALVPEVEEPPTPS